MTPVQAWILVVAAVATALASAANALGTWRRVRYDRLRLRREALRAGPVRPA